MPFIASHIACMNKHESLYWNNCTQCRGGGCSCERASGLPTYLTPTWIHQIASKVFSHTSLHDGCGITSSPLLIISPPTPPLPFCNAITPRAEQHLHHRIQSYKLDTESSNACRMWLEFGVHTGGTLRLTANWKSKHCGMDSSPVHGFDTFTGLPEDWDGQYKKVNKHQYTWFPLNLGVHFHK